MSDPIYLLGLDHKKCILPSYKVPIIPQTVKVILSTYGRPGSMHKKYHIHSFYNRPFTCKQHASLSCMYLWAGYQYNVISNLRLLWIRMFARRLGSLVCRMYVRTLSTPIEPVLSVSSMTIGEGVFTLILEYSMVVYWFVSSYLGILKTWRLNPQGFHLTVQV